MSDSPPRQGDSGVSSPLLWAGLAAAVLLLIPTLLAAPLYLAARRRITRVEALIAVTAALVVVGIKAPQWGPDYLTWLWNLPQAGVGSVLTAPWLGLLATAVVLAGLAVALQSTAVARRVAEKLHLGGDKPALETESIVPSDEQRSAVRLVTPPGTPVTAQRKSTDVEVLGDRYVPLGTDADGRPFSLAEKTFSTHCMVFGSTGSGKSETIKTIAGGLLDLGWSVLVLDLKEDTKPGGLADFCRTYSLHHSVPYQRLALSDQDSATWFNPLAGMGSDEARDTLLSLQSFEAAHYEALNKKALGQLTKLLWDAYAVDPARFPLPSPFQVGQYLNDIGNGRREKIKEIAASVLMNNRNRSKEEFLALTAPSDEERKTMIGLSARIQNVYDTRAADHVLRAAPGRVELDVARTGLTYIGLDSNGKPDLTRMISSSVLQRINVLASVRTRGKSSGPAQVAVIIDEANWVHRRIVQNLLSRARSAGIAVFLCTQGPEDFNQGGSPDDPGFAELAQNVNVGIIMRQGEDKNATTAATWIGRRDHHRITRQVRDGELQETGSLRTDRDFIVTGDELTQRMNVGEAFVRIGTPFAVNWVAVRQRDPRV